MSNFSVVAVYMPFVVGTVLVIVSAVGKDLSKPLVKNFLFLCFSVLGWQITESLFYILDRSNLIETDYNLKVVFVSLSAIFIFRGVVSFYKLNKIPPWVTKVIFVIPAVTLILCFTDLAPYSLRTGFEVTSTFPLNEAIFGTGVWLGISSVFSHVLVIMFGMIVLLMHYRLPKAYRVASRAFIMAGSLFALGYALTFLVEPIIDFILIGCSLGLLAVYYVVAYNERGDYLSIARREIFNYLDVAVFILDEKDQIVDVNRGAKEWIAFMGKEMVFISLAEILNSLEEEGHIEIVPGEAENVSLVRLTNTDILLIYEMTAIEMLDKNGQVKGKFVTLEDVTRNSLFIDRLEIDAGIDPLTGLQNRYTYEEWVVDLNVKENLPISVILGDVNSLKYINDHYGHTAGDTLLSLVGDVMGKCCPKTGYSARIGGDEFVMVVPNCDEVRIADIADEIRMALALIKHLPFEVKMALGCVTKTTVEGSLKNQVNEADLVMYADKPKSREEVR